MTTRDDERANSEASRRMKRRSDAPSGNRQALTRSEIMARVKRRDTGPERILRSALHSRGMRFRVDRRIEGIHADVVFAKQKVAVFVDGCFWHGCSQHATKPRSNTAYWLPKLDENKRRDSRQTALLRQHGWIVLRVWEHECRDRLDAIVARIIKAVDRRRIALRSRDLRMT